MNTLLALYAILLGGSALAVEAPGLLLVGGDVLDVTTGTVMQRHDVLVQGEQIVRVGPGGSIALPAGAEALNVGGLTLIPGLIDLHTHLLLHPYNEASWNDQVLKESLELRTIRAVVAMKATLEAGFTTIRDLGTEGAAFADVALRDAASRGLVPGPRVFASTRALVATGCYGPSGFDPRWSMPKGAQVADGFDGLRRAVREQIVAGADWIKVYADYRRRPGDPATPTYSLAELGVVVDEARSAGLPVAAHAVTDQAIRRAVRAGVSTIEHGYFASTETLTLMREQSVVLCPTLSASEAVARYAGWEPGMPEPQRILDARQLMQRALATGVTIACGSDAGVFAHGDNVREIELMVDYGMPPADALRAATLTAAQVLGLSVQLGSIAEGRLADMVAVAGNPLQDLQILRRPVVVIKGGRVVHDQFP